MATRDPQTGRFTSGPGGGDADYSAFDVQHVVAELNDPDSNHTDLLETFESLVAVDPLGGLGREEVAELVAARYGLSGGYMGGAPGASMTVIGEISFDSTELLINLDADDVTETDIVTGIDTRNLTEVDIDVLWHERGYMHSTEADDVNGVGHGPSDISTEEWVLYRPWFGRGPVVDRHDELHFHMGYNERQGGGTAFRASLEAFLVWDVQER